jgi:hypothetical protein
VQRQKSASPALEGRQRDPGRSRILGDLGRVGDQPIGVMPTADLADPP